MLNFLSTQETRVFNSSLKNQNIEKKNHTIDYIYVNVLHYPLHQNSC